MVKRSTANLVILRNPDDGYEITHFQITGITGGALYQSDGVTAVNIGQFITAEQGEAGLVFIGASNGSMIQIPTRGITHQPAGH